MQEPRPTTYYSATLNDQVSYPALEGDVTADVVVIGGGFTGVNTALELVERGLSVVLLEAHSIGWGASGRNGGQVTGSLSGDAAMTRQLRSSMGAAAEDFVWDLRWRGHDIIRERVAKYEIDCDLKHGHLHAAMKPAHMRDLSAHKEEAERRGMGAQVDLLQKGDIPALLETDIYCGGLLNRRNMHLHSLNLCLGEARAAAKLGVQIFEGAFVTEIIHGARPKVRTRHGSVQANMVLIAGNAYHHLERRKLSGTLFPASLANLATAQLGEDAGRINPSDIAVYDSRFVLDYYRLTADGRLMFGGGTNYSGRHSKNVAAELRPAIERTFPRLKGVEIEYSWTCMAGIVMNRIPQVGRVAPNVYYAQGYSGHGIATSHIVAEIMAEALTGTLGRFDTFSGFKHLRIPMGDRAGQMLLALGMWYYQLREKMR